jgi:hypothetical protein
MSGDDLSIALFLLSASISLLAAGMSQAGWKHRALVIGLFSLSGLFAMAGSSWPWLKPASPNLTKMASDIAGNPVSWFVLFILGLASVVMSGRMRRLPMPVSPSSGAKALDAAVASQSRVQQLFPTTDWDKPLTSVFRQNFKNETVELDGKNFVECTFENVTFLYQGTRPLQMMNCKKIPTEGFFWYQCGRIIQSCSPRLAL